MLDTATYTPRLKELYDTTIRAALKEEFGYKNAMQTPALEKIVLNIGCGRAAVKDSKKSQVSRGRSHADRWSTGCYDHCEELHRGFPRS